MGMGEFKKPIKDSFDVLLEDVRRRAAHESEVEHLLTEIVVEGFVKRLGEDFRDEARLRREEEYSSLTTLKKKNKKEEGVSVDFINSDHVRKGKRLVRKRAPNSVLQTLKEIDECDKKTESKKLGKSKNFSIKLGSEQVLDRASSNRNTEEEEEMRVVPKRRKFVPQALEVNAEPEPDMPEEFKREIERMNGIGILFIMEKSLMDTDISKQNNRLSIPRKQIRNEFLSSEEKTLLDEKKGLDVTVIQPCGKTITLIIKKWVMTNTFCYNLIGGWRKGVVENKANALEIGSVVRLWAFRSESKLCFSLVKVFHEGQR